VEPGESPEQAARRELEEEVGYAAGELVKLATAYATPGYSDEVMHFFAALELERRRAHPEAGEILKMVEVDPDAYLASAGREFLDLKTVAALALCKARGLLR
jgi:ADP-ribose pyrophosphatase